MGHTSSGAVRERQAGSRAPWSLHQSGDAGNLIDEDAHGFGSRLGVSANIHGACSIAVYSTPLHFPARQLVELLLERGGATFGGLKLTPQEFVGFACRPALLAKGFERCELHAQLVDFRGPAHLVRVFAFLGASEFGAQLLHLVLQVFDASWRWRWCESTALIGEQSVNPGNSAARFEAFVQSFSDRRARRESVTDGQFPDHGPHFGVGNARWVHGSNVHRKRKDFRFEVGGSCGEGSEAVESGVISPEINALFE